MRNAKIRKLALSGIYLALTEVFLIGASVAPGVEMTFFAVTSAAAAFVIIETGIRNGIVFFAAASLLGFAIVPNKTALLPYVMFFGIYPAVKYFAEKLKSSPAQLAVKFGYFIVVLLAAYFLMFDIFFGNIRLPGWMPVFVIIPAALVLFALLDAVLTAVINIYFKRIHSRFVEN